jgi:hypothetical protein
MSTFMREQYKVIAGLFKKCSCQCSTWDYLVGAFADTFERDNPNFKRLLFIEKCQAGEK